MKKSDLLYIVGGLIGISISKLIFAKQEKEREAEEKRIMEEVDNIAKTCINDMNKDIIAKHFN